METKETVVKPLSVFIAFNGNVEELLGALGQALGLSLAPVDLDVGRVFRCVSMDIEFVLIPDHGTDDDGGIDFASFKYQLNLVALRVGLSARSYGAMYRFVAVYLAEWLSTKLHSRTQVIANLQQVIESFVPSPDLLT